MIASCWPPLSSTCQTSKASPLAVRARHCEQRHKHHHQLWQGQAMTPEPATGPRDQHGLRLCRLVKSIAMVQTRGPNRLTPPGVTAIEAP